MKTVHYGIVYVLKKHGKVFLRELSELAKKVEDYKDERHHYGQAWGLKRKLEAVKEMCGKFDPSAWWSSSESSEKHSWHIEYKIVEHYQIYIAPSEWSALLPLLGDKRKEFKSQEGPTQITLHFPPALRTEVLALLEKAKRIARVKDPKGKVKVVHLVGKRFEGTLLVGAVTKKAANEIAKRELPRISKETGEKMKIDRIENLSDYEEELDSIVERELLPEIDQFNLIDLGT